MPATDFTMPVNTFWKRTRAWGKELKNGSETRRYSVELVRKWPGCGGDKCRIYTNGTEIKNPTVYKRTRGLEICSSDAHFMWDFDGHSFLLVRTPTLRTLSVSSDFHLFIDGVDVSTSQTLWNFWRRRAWLLMYFGVIKILFGILLESLRYLQDPIDVLVVLMIVGRVVLLFGLLQVIEGVTIILSRPSPTICLPVETV